MKKKAKKKPRRAIREYDGEPWLCVRVASYLRKSRKEVKGYRRRDGTRVKGYRRRIRVKAHWRRIMRVRYLPQEIEEEHERLLKEEKSPRLTYIEGFYVDKLLEEEETLDAAIEKVREISSLTEEEQEHVIDHLALSFERGRRAK